MWVEYVWYILQGEAECNLLAVIIIYYDLYATEIVEKFFQLEKDACFFVFAVLSLMQLWPILHIIKANHAISAVLHMESLCS